MSSTIKFVTLMNVSDGCLASVRMALMLLASNVSSIRVTTGPSNIVRTSPSVSV